MKGKVSPLMVILVIVAALSGCAPRESTVRKIVAREIGEALTVDLPGGATMEMVWIPPGTFVMGSPQDEKGRARDEGPQHEVTISRGFWLSK